MQMRTKWLISKTGRVGLGVVVLLLLCTACSKVTPPEVPGRYTCDHEFGKEELVILQNGQFRQTVYLKQPPNKLETGGKWEFDPIDCRIIFRDGLIPVVDNSGKLETKLERCRTAMLPIFREFWRIKIMLNESVYYTKRPDNEH